MFFTASSDTESGQNNSTGFSLPVLSLKIIFLLPRHTLKLVMFSCRKELQLHLKHDTRPS